MVYEGLILIPVVILVFLSLKNYISNRSSLSLLLFLILSCYAFSIVFSWFSKLLSVCFQIDYLEIKEIPDPKTAISWILFRISYYRITFVFINLAILFSFEFKKRIFNIRHSKIYRRFIYFLAGFNVTFSFFIFEKKILILDVIVFTLALIFECIVYIPFFMESLKNYRITIHPNFKKKFLNLLIMSISFILVLFFLSLDRIFIFFGIGAYTFFYFISWIFVIIGIFTAYRAYFK